MKGLFIVVLAMSLHMSLALYGSSSKVVALT